MVGNHGGSRGRWWVRSVGDGGYVVVVGDGDPGRGRWRSLSWAMEILVVGDGDCFVVVGDGVLVGDGG